MPSIEILQLIGKEILEKAWSNSKAVKKLRNYAQSLWVIDDLRLKKTLTNRYKVNNDKNTQLFL